MNVSVDRIKEAMDEFIADNIPHDDYHPASWYRDNFYPNMTSAKVRGILAAMVNAGSAERSEKQYNEVWYYKVKAPSE